MTELVTGRTSIPIQQPPSVIKYLLWVYARYCHVLGDREIGELEEFLSLWSFYSRSEWQVIHQ